MLRLRVLNGTKPDVRLCDTCRHSHITSDSKGGEHILCYHPGYPVQVYVKIVECNQYAGIRDMTDYEAQKIGWILEVRGKTIVGFKPPEKK
jgi:hypothetical protein